MVTPASSELAAVRAGDGAAFVRLVNQYTPGMLCCARGFVDSEADAEEVVRQTWISVLDGLHTVDTGAPVQAWLFGVLIGIAGARTEQGDAGTGPTVDPARFHGPDAPAAGTWKEPPPAFPEPRTDSVSGSDLRGPARRALRRISRQQRVVVTLRDIVGFDADEVCRLLGLTADAQRVLLHRGRAAIRAALEEHLSHSDVQG